MSHTTNYKRTYIRNNFVFYCDLFLNNCGKRQWRRQNNYKRYQRYYLVMKYVEKQKPYIEQIKPKKYRQNMYKNTY